MVTEILEIIYLLFLKENRLFKENNFLKQNEILKENGFLEENSSLGQKRLFKENEFLANGLSGQLELSNNNGLIGLEGPFNEDWTLEYFFRK